MAQNNPTPPTGGSTPWGRIAGVAVLASGVVALTVVAINNESGQTRLSDQTTQTALQTQSASGETPLAQADLSGGQPSDELRSNLSSQLSKEEAANLLATTRPSKEEVDANGRNKAGTDRIQPTNLDTNPNANIEFESLVFDFGNIYSTKEIPGKFTFTSTGTEPLTIVQVRPACGCTSANAAELRNSTWQPGEGSTIEFSYRPDQKAGAQSKTISVTTDSQENRVVTLTLKANYIPAVKFSTQNVNFGRIEAGSIGQSRVVIEARDPNMEFTEFDLGEFSDDYDWEYTKLEPVSEDFPSRAQLLIRTKPDARIGTFSRVVGQFKAKSREGDAQEPTELSFNILLMGQVIGLIDLQPPFARAPLGEPGSPFEYTVIVNSSKGVPFKVTDVKFVEGDASDFEYEVQPVEDSSGTQQRLIIHGKAPNRTGGYMGKVDVFTDLPNHGPIQFQFSGVLRTPTPVRN